MRYFWYILCVIWSVVGCSTTKHHEQQSPQEDISDVRIILQRTPCFGTCPIYTVTVTGRGDVQFIGTQYVYKEGEARKQISVDSVRTLIRMFKDIQFSNLNDEYEDRAMSDAPSAIVTYATKDRSKTVKHYLGDMSAPEQLKKLEQAIDRIAKVHEWVNPPRE
ncbi:MAG: hypothetical protein IPK11_09765 [Ignavibacteria bacterium]|jgi:hypothetical protein|nr:hypothetical protein [Ignavibacteria bacterium]